MYTKEFQIKFDCREILSWPNINCGINEVTSLDIFVCVIYWKRNRSKYKYV